MAVTLLYQLGEGAPEETLKPGSGALGQMAAGARTHPAFHPPSMSPTPAFHPPSILCTSVHLVKYRVCNVECTTMCIPR